MATENGTGTNSTDDQGRGSLPLGDLESVQQSREIGFSHGRHAMAGAGC
jgi:hypothetical protein